MPKVRAQTIRSYACSKPPMRVLQVGWVRPDRTRATTRPRRTTLPPLSNPSLPTPCYTRQRRNRSRPITATSRSRSPAWLPTSAGPARPRSTCSPVSDQSRRDLELGSLYLGRTSRAIKCAIS